MNSFNRAASYLLIAGLFGLSACVFTDRGHDDRGAPQGEARRDHDDRRQDAGDRGCDADHRGEGCRDTEHH